eukprot:gene12978-8829_t
MDGVKLASVEPYDVKQLQDEYHSFSPRDTYIQICHQMSCKVVPDVAKIFPHSIGAWDDVTSVDLSRTYVGPKGLQVILQMCMRLPRLVSFSVADNHLTNDSAYAVAQMALFHPSLVEVDLSRNRFVSWSGAMWLLELAQRNPQITNVQIYKTSIDTDCAEAIFVQTRRNAATVFASRGVAAVPANHPSVIHLRAMKRFFSDIQENGTVPVTALVDGFHEQLRIMGRQRDAVKYTDSFFQSLMGRAPSQRLDWNAFAIVLFAHGTTFDQETCESLHKVFMEFNVDSSPGKGEPIVEVKDFPLIHQRLYNAVLDPADLQFYLMRLGLERHMTVTWDEFLITFFPRGPEQGMKPIGILGTPLGTPERCKCHLRNAAPPEEPFGGEQATTTQRKSLIMPIDRELYLFLPHPNRTGAPPVARRSARDVDVCIYPPPAPSHGTVDPLDLSTAALCLPLQTSDSVALALFGYSLSQQIASPAWSPVWSCERDDDTIQNVLRSPSLSGLDAAPPAVEFLIVTAKGLVHRLLLDTTSPCMAVRDVTPLHAVALGGRVTHSVAAPTPQPTLLPEVRQRVCPVALAVGGEEASGTPVEVVWLEDGAPRSLFRCRATRLCALLWDPLQLLLLVVGCDGPVEVFSWQRERLVAPRLLPGLRWSPLKYGRPTPDCAVLVRRHLWIGTERGHVVVLDLREGAAPSDGSTAPLPLAADETEALPSPVHSLAVMGGGREVWAHRDGEGCFRCWAALERRPLRTLPLPAPAPAALVPGWDSPLTEVVERLHLVLRHGNTGSAEAPAVAAPGTLLAVHTIAFPPSCGRQLLCLEAAELRRHARESGAAERDTAELLAYLSESLQDDRKSGEGPLERLVPSETHYAAAASIKLALEQFQQCHAVLRRHHGAVHGPLPQAVGELCCRCEAMARATNDFLAGFTSWWRRSAQSQPPGLEDNSEPLSPAGLEDVLACLTAAEARPQAEPVLRGAHRRTASSELTSGEDEAPAAAAVERAAALEMEIGELRAALDAEARRRRELEDELTVLARQDAAGRELLSRREEQIETLRRSLGAAQLSAREGAEAATELFQMGAQLEAANEKISSLQSRVAELTTREAALQASVERVGPLEKEVAGLRARERLAQLAVEEFRDTENTMLEALEALAEVSQEAPSERLRGAITGCYELVTQRVEEQKLGYPKSTSTDTNQQQKKLISLSKTPAAGCRSTWRYTACVAAAVDGTLIYLSLLLSRPRVLLEHGAAERNLLHTSISLNTFFYIKGAGQLIAAADARTAVSYVPLTQTDIELYNKKYREIIYNNYYFRFHFFYYYSIDFIIIITLWLRDCPPPICVLVSHMGAVEMKRTFEITGAPPRTRSDLRRLLQAQDLRLQQMPFSFTGSLPPYGGQVKFNSDSAVVDFFGKCHESVTFDVIIEGNNVPNVQAELVDEDMVTLHIYPEKSSATSDVLERMFFIPASKIATAMARSVKLTVLDEPQGAANLVVFVIQNNRTKMPLTDEAKLRELLRSHARSQTPVRVTYKWEMADGSDPPQNQPQQAPAPSLSTRSPVPSPAPKREPIRSSLEEQPCIRPKSRSTSSSNSKLFATRQPEPAAPAQKGNPHSASQTPRQPPDTTVRSATSPKAVTAPTSATTTPVGGKMGPRSSAPGYGIKEPVHPTTIPDLAPPHALPKRSTPTGSPASGPSSNGTPQESPQRPPPPKQLENSPEPSFTAAPEPASVEKRESKEVQGSTSSAQVSHIPSVPRGEGPSSPRHSTDASSASPAKQETPAPKPNPAPPQTEPQTEPQPTPPLGREMEVSVSVLQESRADSDFIFRYRKGQADLLPFFTATCAKKVQVLSAAPHEVRLQVCVGKEHHALETDAELLEWAAMSREAGRPLRVRLLLHLVPQPPKENGVNPSPAAESAKQSRASEVRSQPPSQTLSTASAAPSENKTFLTPVVPPKGAADTNTPARSASSGRPPAADSEREEKQPELPGARAAAAPRGDSADQASSTAHKWVISHKAGNSAPSMVCVASSKFGKLLQSFVCWGNRETLVMCRLRSGSLMADLKRAICFEFGVPPKTESSSLFLAYRMYCADTQNVKEGEVHNDVQLGMVVGKCEVPHIIWQIQSKSTGMEGMTGVFEFEVSMLAAELIAHLGEAFRVSEMQALLGSSKKYFKESQQRFFVQLEAMPEAMIRVTKKDLESLLQRCFKDMDTAEARIVSSTCMAKLKICLKRQQALKRFFSVIFRSMRKPNGQVPLAVLEEMFEGKSDVLSATLRSRIGDQSSLSEEELTTILMKRFEEEQHDLLNGLSMAALEGVIRQNNYFEYPMNEAGHNAVVGQYQQHLQSAVNNFTPADLERFCRDVQASTDPLMSVILSVVGALLAPFDTQNFVSYMLEHCKGKVTQVLHSRMRNFKQTQPPLPLPTVYSVSWVLLRPQLDPVSLAPMSPVGAALVEWAFMAIQLECVARDNVFPVMPPFNGVPPAVLPITCEAEGMLCFLQNEQRRSASGAASPADAAPKKTKIQYNAGATRISLEKKLAQPQHRDHTNSEARLHVATTKLLSFLLYVLQSTSGIVEVHCISFELPPLPFLPPQHTKNEEEEEKGKILKETINQGSRMLRWSARRLSEELRKKLANGTELRGVFNPKAPLQLLDGIAVLPDGRVYRGKFDEKSGAPLPGSRLEDDGDLYEGEYNHQWQREGCGRAWLADGTCYEGRFEADELVEGTVRIPQGTQELVFEGTLKDEAFVRGRLTSPEYVYEGEFRDNEPDGKGKLVFATGAEQSGTFRRGKLHGKECKMKLEGGFVYIGEFLDGVVRYGKLFTPTYTYEGEFNEHGRAHGTGTQTYLTQDPKLIFTGIWESGAMVRGQVADEFGTPVDWQNDHAAQSSIYGDGDAELGAERVALNSFCSSKVAEAHAMREEMHRSYAEDAAAVSRATGKFPSRMDLRYEGGIREEREGAHRSAQKQMKEMEECRERSAETAPQTAAAVGEASEALGDIFNANMAKINFSRELGAQELSANRADEQLGRFLRTFRGRKPSSILDEDDYDGEGPESRLNINGNAAWKTFTPPPRS